MERAVIERTIENLKRNGFSVKYFEDSRSAKEAILNEIGPDQTVGFGGSMTVADLGIYEALKEKGNHVYWHWKAGEGEDRKPY